MLVIKGDEMDSALNNAAVDKMDLNRDAWLLPDTSAYDDAVIDLVNEWATDKPIDFLVGKVHRKVWDKIIDTLTLVAQEKINQQIKSAQAERRAEQEHDRQMWGY